MHCYNMFRLCGVVLDFLPEFGDMLIHGTGGSYMELWVMVPL